MYRINLPYPLVLIAVLFVLLLTGCRPAAAPAESIQQVAVATTQSSSAGLEQSAATPTAVPATAAAANLDPTPANTPNEPTALPTIAPTTAAESLPATQPVQPPTASPTATAQPPPAQSDCTNLAAFYGDVTIPDNAIFSQGESFTKIWRVHNAGTCTWNSSYRLVHHSGEIMNAALSQPISHDVPPGADIDLSVEMVAPARGGSHTSFWWLEDPSGERFGMGSSRKDLMWVIINVRHFTEQGQPQGDPASLPTPPPVAGCNAQADQSVASQVLVLINQERANKGLPLLAKNAALNAAALRHSRDMACNSFVDHAGSDGTSWYDRIRAEGYSSSNANENIYVGFPDFGGTAQGAVTWWMNSQVHRDNILNPANSEAGIGYVYDPASQWGGYYTVVFARP